MGYRFLMPHIASKAKHLFTVSETMKKEIIKILNISESKIDITYNGLPEFFLTQRAVKIVKQKIILAVGSINKRKNYERLIRSFIKFADQDYKMIIVGKHNEIYSNDTIIQELISANKNIELLTTNDDKALMELYAASEIFICLSNYEGFCIPILEALYFNCKIICSDLEVFHEIYDSHVNYTDHTNMDAIVDSLNLCIKKKQINVDEISKLEEKYNYKNGARIILDFVNKKTILQAGT
jgi:glycosyltransferase involved in cell wall biosynthesis